MRRFVLSFLAMFVFLFPAVSSHSAFGQETGKFNESPALKKLDWKISVSGYTFRKFTFMEAVDRIAALNVDLMEGYTGQLLETGDKSRMNPATLTDAQLAKVKAKLQEKKVKLIALYVSFTPDEAVTRKLFERSKQLGVKIFVGEPKPEYFPLLDKLSNEFGIYVGLHGHAKQASPTTWHPSLVYKQCEQYSKYIGAFSDTGHWIRSELVPAEGVKVLKDRTIGFELHDLDVFNAEGKDVPIGTGVGNMTEFFKTLVQVKKGPVLISVDYLSQPEDPSDGIRKSIECIKKAAETLAAQK
ncbi:MAG: hypothetical protein PHQ75_06690 [Thermoguttaceae bacterium]|nr:hypothetical protein [Thermoguttaceae bacterium]